MQLHVVVLSLLVGATSAQISSFTLPDFGAERSYGVVGDVTIAGLFPIFEYSTAPSGSQCSVYRGYGAINNAQAFTFVLERHGRTLSARTDDGDWRNLSLGFIIADMCGESGQLGSTRLSIQLLDASEARPRLCPTYTSNNWTDSMTGDSILSPVAMIGPTANAAAEAIAPLLGEYNIPLVSPEADSQELTCVISSTGEPCGHEYEYFYRTVSPNYFLAAALVDLAVHGFSWQFVGVLYQDDVTGSTAAENFLAENDRLTTSTGRPHRLCVAFHESIPVGDCCKSQIKRVIYLIRKYEKAKVIFVFARSPAVITLMNAIVEDVARQGTALPRVWIGRDDYWGTGDIIYNKQYTSATLSAAIHLRSRLPPHLGWFYQTIYKDFVVNNSRLSPQRLSDRNSPLNPWLCQDLETVGDNLCLVDNECFLTEDELEKWNEKTCNITSALIDRLYADNNRSFVDQLGASHTLLATEVVIQALNDLLQEFVRREPNITMEELPSLFKKFAFGVRLNTAIAKVKLGKDLGCRQEGGCQVFDEQLHDPGSPSYFVLWTNHDRKEQTIVGSWTENTSSKSDRLQLSSSSILSWGSLNAKSGAKSPPSSFCAPVCPPGSYAESVPSLRCCHSCLPCGGSNFSNTTNSPICLQCEIHNLANDNHTACYPFPEKRPPNRFIWFFVLGVFWTILLVGPIVSVILFNRNIFQKLIRRNIVFNRVLVVAMVMCLLSIALYAVPASEWFCKYRSLFPTPWYIMSVATILVRTFRLARIVKRYREGDTQLIERLWSFRSPAQLTFILALTLIGILLQAVLIFIVKLDMRGTKRINTESTFFTVCHAEIRTDAIIDSYLITMLFLSIGLAFRTRKLPQFRKAVFDQEARPLFFATFCLAAIWLIILVIRSLSSDENEALLAIIRAIGHVSSIWLWLFLPKVYAILSQTEGDLPKTSTLVSLSEQSSELSEIHANASRVRLQDRSLRGQTAVIGNPGFTLVDNLSPPGRSFTELVSIQETKTLEASPVESPMASDPMIKSKFIYSDSDPEDSDPAMHHIAYV